MRGFPAGIILQTSHLIASFFGKQFIAAALIAASCGFEFGPASAAAIGSVDGVSKGQIVGWTFDQSSAAAGTDVVIYMDGPKGVGKLVANFATTGLRSDVNAFYSTSGYHGFAWSMPAAEQKSLHIWFVYGTGVDGSLALLSNGPATYPPISAAATGGSQTVVAYQTNACETLDIPDHPARAFRTADGNVNLIASHINARRAVGTTLDNVKHQCAVIHGSLADPTFQDFNYYQWLQAPYTLDGKTIYEVMHNEWYGNIVKPACNGDLIDGWISAITLSISSNGGANFTEPNDYIVRNPTTPWNNSFPCSSAAPTRYGDLGGSNIIRRGAYYYKFFQYETEPSVVPAQTRQCVMRTTNLASASSWSVWNGVGWTQSKTAPCAPVPVLQNARAVTYSMYLHMYTAIQWFPPQGFAFSVSFDLLNWSSATLISTPGLDTSTTPYPSLLDPADTSMNFERITRKPYIYYTQLHNGSNGDLMRIPIKFTISIPD